MSATKRSAPAPAKRPAPRKGKPPKGARKQLGRPPKGLPPRKQTTVRIDMTFYRWMLENIPRSEGMSDFINEAIGAKIRARTARKR